MWLTGRARMALVHGFAVKRDERFESIKALRRRYHSRFSLRRDFISFIMHLTSRGEAF